MTTIASLARVDNGNTPTSVVDYNAAAQTLSKKCQKCRNWVPLDNFGINQLIDLRALSHLAIRCKNG